MVLLIDRQYSWQMATSVLGPGWIAGPGIELLRENPRLGRRLRRARPPDPRLDGQRPRTTSTSAWPLGVEAVITDDPRPALDHLDGRSVAHRTSS